MPLLLAPVTKPVAVTLVKPVPLLVTAMPPLPLTAAALTVRSVAVVPLVA